MNKLTTKELELWIKNTCPKLRDKIMNGVDKSRVIEAIEKVLPSPTCNVGILTNCLHCIKIALYKELGLND